MTNTQGTTMKTKLFGGTMDFLIIFAVAVILCFWGIKKYNDSEMTDYKKLLESNIALKGELAEVKKSNEDLGKRMDDMTSTLMTYKGIIEQGTATISAYEAKLKKADEEMEDVHTQNAKLQKDVALLNGKSFPKQVEFTMKHTGPFQIEILKAPAASAPPGTPKPTPTPSSGSPIRHSEMPPQPIPPKAEDKKALGKGLKAILPDQPSPAH